MPAIPLPIIQSILNPVQPFLRRLVHLTLVNPSHTRVVEDFLCWCGEDYIFCTWGPLDLAELQRNLRFYGMEPLARGPIAFLDVQKLFSIAYEDRKSRRALEWAVDFLKIKFL